MTRAISGRARFAMPADLSRFGVAVGQMDLTAPSFASGSAIRAASAPIRGSASAGGRSGCSPAAAPGRRRRLLRLDRRRRRSPRGRSWSTIAYALPRQRLAGLAPRAGDTLWRLRSPWPHPVLPGRLPARRSAGSAAQGFDAAYRVGNLALGQSLVSTGDAGTSPRSPADPGAAADHAPRGRARPAGAAAGQPDPAGRPLFAGQPRGQIRLPVHRLHLPRLPDVRRDRRGAGVGGRISAGRRRR